MPPHRQDIWAEGRASPLGESSRQLPRRARSRNAWSICSSPIRQHEDDPSAAMIFGPIGLVCISKPAAPVAIIVAIVVPHPLHRERQLILIPSPWATRSRSHIRADHRIQAPAECRVGVKNLAGRWVFVEDRWRPALLLRWERAASCSCNTPRPGPSHRA